MNSRRFTANPPDAPNPSVSNFQHRSKRSDVRFWVKNGSWVTSELGPFIPQQRTCGDCIGMSFRANCGRAVSHIRGSCGPRPCEKPKTLDCVRISNSFKTAGILIPAIVSDIVQPSTSLKAPITVRITLPARLNSQAANTTRPTTAA